MSPRDDAPRPDWRSGLARRYFESPRLLVLTLALIAVAGLSAFELLPRREDPELVGRFAVITTRLPGASAEQVEALVTEKIEEELREVEEIGLLVSTSSTGISQISIDLADEVSAAAVDGVWSKVRARLDDAAPALPPGAAEPEFEDQAVDALALIAALAWEGDGAAPRGVLSRLAEELEDRLRALPGSQETTIVGASREELLVEVDAARLAALGLDVDALANALAEGDSKVPAGRLHAAGAELALEVAGEFDGLARVREVVIATDATGGAVTVGDLATVSRGVADPPDDLAWIDGRPGVAVGAILENGVRVDRWAAEARALLADFERELPRGVALERIFDQSGYTEARLADLGRNLVLGAAGVVLVLLLLMGWRSAVLVGIALPLTSLMVLAEMRWLGVPIHQMSVTGLIIALGLLIDNAIVMVDEVRHQRDEGHPPLAAISESLRRLAVPLAGSTLTTVFAFLPIVLMPGPAGEFVGAIGLSVILALLSSLFLALTVVPALTGLLARACPIGTRASAWHRGLSSSRLRGAYERTLDLLLRHPVLGVALAVALPVAGFVQAGQLEEQFFPPTDRDQFQVQLWLPQQASIDETSAALQRLRAAALEHDEVVAVHGFAGRSAPKFYYNIPEGTEGAPYYGQALVQVRDARETPRVVRELQRELDAALPSAQVVARLLEQGPPFDAPVELRVTGPDLAVLDAVGREVRSVLAATPGVVHTRTTLDSDRPELRVEPDELEARRAGFGRVELARALEALLDGRLAGSQLEGTEELPVRVRVAGAERADLGRVASLPLAVDGAAGGGAGAWTTLDALGEITLRPEYGTIVRRDGRRENTVQGFLEAGLLPSVVLEVVQARLDELDLPTGTAIVTGGESAERDDAVGKLMASVGLLLVLMVATLVLSFDSFRLAGVIGAVGVQAVGLALLALWVWGYPFGFMAIIGAMGLVGVAINDSIVVLAGIRDDADARAGDRVAIRKVVVRSTRHVLSTTFTTMAGFTPLVVSGGQFWPPLAVAIGFGVLGSTLLALTFAPASYVLLFRRAAPRAEPAQSELPFAPAGA